MCPWVPYPPAGRLALQSLDIAQDVGQTALHMRNLGVGGMVRMTASESARQTLMHPGPSAASAPMMIAAPPPQGLLAYERQQLLGDGSPGNAPFPVATAVSVGIPVARGLAGGTPVRAVPA